MGFSGSQALKTGVERLCSDKCHTTNALLNGKKHLLQPPKDMMGGDVMELVVVCFVDNAWSANRHERTWSGSPEHEATLDAADAQTIDASAMGPEVRDEEAEDEGGSSRTWSKDFSPTRCALESCE